MKAKEQYLIPFKGLAIGSHSFNWVIDQAFFTRYEMSEISDASINVCIDLLKNTQFLELNFILSGWAEVICDRCLDSLKVDVVLENKMYVKFSNVDNIQDTDDVDIIVLPYNEDHLDVTQFIYEYAHLGLPIRRVHPDDATGKSSCNQEMLKRLEQYLIK